MELCEHCNEIDFRAAGLHAPGDPEFNFFSMGDIPFLQVNDKVKECSFCEMVSKFFFQWAEANYGGIDRLSLPEAGVGFAAQRIKGLENDDDYPPSTSPSLFRISVTYTIQDPYGGGFIGPKLVFQKCATEKNDVASMFKMPVGPGWPEYQEPYLGRIRPLLADSRLFKKWKEYCLTAHHGKCGAWFKGEKPPKIRLIDVEQECMVEFTEDVQWIALSYLWGETKILTLEKDSLCEFQRPGFLSCDRVPRTIYDAMLLTAALGETYLWVDSLCIVQDDPIDKLQYIPHMDAIYGHATLTIIDAAGSNAQSGLPGIRQGSRTQLQTPFKVKGVTLVQTLDPINISSIGYLTESKWNKRGWTFQEGILSPRALIFTAEQAYWQCSEASWCEDGFWECPNSPTIYRHCLRDEFRNILSPDKEFAEDRYRHLVEVYSQRTLTFERDGLDAFQGIIGAFERVSGLQFLWGLPTMYLGAALTWPAHDEEIAVRRRTALCNLKNSRGEIAECPFPSWSWVGWVGKVHFDEVFGLLTSRHVGIVFHKIYPDGETEIISQSSDFKEAYEESQLPGFTDGEPDPSRPDWRDESRTAITKADIPSAVFSLNLSAIVLGFWSSTVLVTMQYSHAGGESGGERSTVPKLIHNGDEIKALWDQIPRHPCELDAEDARLIIIGRNTLSTLRAREELVAIVANLENDEGLSYRKAIVSIRESDWNNLESKKWERIFLA
jgi:hypothetical protein